MLITGKKNCEPFELFIEHLESVYGDKEFMDEDILEALCEKILPTL